MARTLRTFINRLLGPTRYVVEKKRPWTYDEDGLRTLHNAEFLHTPEFLKAYQRGIKAADADYHFRWRAHVALWVAYSASRLRGDFVECGVNRGFVSSAICEYLNWNSLGKTFYLLDTFQGLDERFVSEEEKAAGHLERNRKHLDSGFYVAGVESVKKNFSEWERIVFVEGAIPESLSRVPTREVAYLHIDLNCSPPEVAAVEFFWDRLVPGAFILFDDYTQVAFDLSKKGMDECVARKGARVLSLPTGQGLLVKTGPSSAPG